MNKHEINQSQLNGSVVHNVVVDLGSATATLNFVVFERALTELSGTAGISFSALGDITKYAQIGTASAGITFGESGSLTRFRQVLIPSATSSIGLTATAGLYNQKSLPSASSSFAFSAAADIYVVGDLAGTAALTFNVSSSAGPQTTKLLGAAAGGISLTNAGSLTQYVKRSIPAAEALLEFEVDGALTKHVKQYISAGNAPIVFTATGDLTKYGRVYMSGSSGITVTENAALRATSRMGAANFGITFATTAAITNKRVDIPAASAAMVFIESGSLSKGMRQTIPFAGTTATFSTTAALTRKANIGDVSAAMSLTLTANLSTIQKLNGATGIVFSESANIFNNPNAIDPPAFVMVRPFVDRVMVRRS